MLPIHRQYYISELIIGKEICLDSEGERKEKSRVGRRGEVAA